MTEESQLRWESPRLRIVLDRARIDVRELAQFSEALETVNIAASAVINRLGLIDRPAMARGWQDERAPDGPVYMARVISVRNESPVMTVLESLDVPALIGLTAYFLKNPAHLRTWFSRYRVDRDVARAREQAVHFWRKQIEEMTDENGVAVSDLPEPPEWIIGKA